MSDEEETLMTFAEFKTYLLAEGHPLVDPRTIITVSPEYYLNAVEVLYHFMVLRVMDQEGLLYPLGDTSKVVQLTRKEWHRHAAAFFKHLIDIGVKKGEGKDSA